MTKTRITIRGMSCRHCVAAVRRELDRLPGVKVNDVTIGSADLEYDETRVSLEQIGEAVREAGYAFG